jgi:hypothetical protein
MKAKTTATVENEAARTLAPEDLRAGDYVSLDYEIIDLPSFFWCCDAQILPPGEPVRMPWQTADCGQPLKIKAICLPYVFVKKPSGEYRTLDVRRHRLVRLSSNYARAVWKALNKRATSETV